MNPFPKPLLLIAAVIFMAIGCRAEIGYSGFTIHEEACSALPELDTMVSQSKEQIDIASGVGESQELLQFFQGLRITLKPIQVPGGTPGLYLGAPTREVEIYPRIMITGHKPVLLHEMLHAYHDQKLPDGFMNSEILRYYMTAKSLHLFDNQSHMMSNQREFFACAATTYLYGVTAQEPFTRDRLKQCDPEFYSYLQKLFGPGAGTYTGWLSLMENTGTPNRCVAMASILP
jgi:hypothetical protein